jgi:hypothetical protein
MRLAATLDGTRRGRRAAECVEEVTDDEKQSTVHMINVARDTRVLRFCLAT